MFNALKPLEDKLAKVFKDLPQLSASAKKSLAEALKWLSLVFGLLQLLSVWWLWNAGRRADDYVDFANSFSRVLGVDPNVHHLGPMFYIALVVMALSAVTLLLAYPKLNQNKKEGWDWLFVGSLLNLVYGVVAIFVDKVDGGGFGKLVTAAIGSAVSFWILYQVRDHFTGHAKVAAPHHTAEKK